ncbi:MAG: ParB N-terminal domain-containing protein [Deltaproteobacteria bacterium]|nr:ParB N-terminal domain-containing protein [Deltaproteobacteria bacterium]
MELIEVDRLRHIEGYSQRRAQNIRKTIQKDGVWKRPLCIERTHLLVLDGQHRLEAARSLGMRLVPCQMFDYDEVEVWSLRSNHEVTRELVIAKALRGDIYPYKTAKHRFPRDVEALAIPLAELRRA